MIPASLFPNRATHYRYSNQVCSGAIPYSVSGLTNSYTDYVYASVSVEGMTADTSVFFVGIFNGVSQNETLPILQIGTHKKRSVKQWSSITSVQCASGGTTLSVNAVYGSGQPAVVLQPIRTNLLVRTRASRFPRIDNLVQGPTLHEVGVLYCNIFDAMPGDIFEIDAVKFEAESVSIVYQGVVQHHSEVSIRRLS